MNAARGVLLRQGCLTHHRCRTASNAVAVSSVPLAAVGPDRVLPAPDYRTWLADGAVMLRIQASGPQSPPPISIPTLLRQIVERVPNHLALGSKGPQGENLLWTYSQYLEEVELVARGFIALGLVPHHSVCILGYNAPEWVISNLAAVHARGFAAGIYQTNNPKACRYVAHHSRANIIVVEDDHQLQKILSVKAQLPHLKAVVQYRGQPSQPGVLSWSDLLEIGKLEPEQSLQERLRESAVNQCALLVYTSGTTGNPKGAMLSHDSVVITARETTSIFGWRFGEERIVSYLPLSHVAGLMMDLYYPLSKGATTYFADSNALKGSLVDNLKEYKPTRFLGVPRVWEKIEERIREAGKTTTGLKRTLADWAKKEALEHHLRRDGGDPSSRLTYRLAKRLVLSKVHAALGLDEVVDLEVATGGAATPASTHKFFLSLDIRLLDVYGSTESAGSPQSSGQPGPGNCRIGTIGKTPPGLIENKILYEDQTPAAAGGGVGDGGVGGGGSGPVGGELCSRGRTIFMGYLNDPEKTLEALDDEGWMHSGDVCTQDSDGFFTIVGRKKEIIITAGGENIAPVNIEDEIKRALPHLVSNVMVVGDQRKYLTCLITLKVKPDPTTLQPTRFLETSVLEILRSHGMEEVETVDQLLASEGFTSVVADLIQAGIEEANKKAISRAAKVRRWLVIPQDFSVQGGEFSPSLKLKRYYVADLYKSAIDELYYLDQTSFGMG